MWSENASSPSELNRHERTSQTRSNGQALQGLENHHSNPKDILQRLVLIVEDEPMIRWSGADMLREAGFDVIEAGGADDALTILHAHRVGVLFTDVDMPGSINGLELAHIARGLWPALRILVTSGKCKPGPAAMPKHGRFVDKPYAQERIVRDIGAMF